MAEANGEDYMISVSVVSHGQMTLVSNLLDDIQAYCENTSLELILTLNTPHEPIPNFECYGFPIVVIQNDLPKGFGANHNQAFVCAKGGYFCVLNPDVRLQADPFPALMACLADPSVGVSAPMVLNGEGHMDDSARYFPSPLSIACKVLGFSRSARYDVGQTVAYPDWVAGMFMLFNARTFSQLNGFDERYFLYYEDVDICGRLTNMGLRVAWCPSAQVIHLAQRTSHRNFKYLRWHVTSMLKFFSSRNYWRLLWK